MFRYLVLLCAEFLFFLFQFHEEICILNKSAIEEGVIDDDSAKKKAARGKEKEVISIQKVNRKYFVHSSLIIISISLLRCYFDFASTNLC